MKGIVIGGNIRCFLKLAGTKYMPDPEGKILFLESLGGGPSRIASLLTQLRQIGFLEKINGIIFGTFSELESKRLEPDIRVLVKDMVHDIAFPIVKTSFLGHEDNSCCIVIGKKIELKR